MRNTLESYATEKISEKRFDMLSAEYEQKQEALEASIAKAQAELDAFEADTAKVDQFLALAKKYSPNASVTRATVWTVLARMNGIDINGGSTWYEKAQKWVISMGISDGSNPEKIVSRQEVITMLYRQAGSPPVKNQGNYATAFGDMKDIAGWAYDPVVWAIQNYLLNIYYSSGMLYPTQGALRWELAYLLTQYDMNIV